MKKLVDLIYGTERVRRNYEQANPEERIIAADGSKGIITENDQDIIRGANWVTSQRAVLLLTNRKIVCGKWIIPFEQIKSSRLLKIRSMFGDGAVLKIQTIEGTNYQFGMQVNPEWTNQQAIPLSYEEVKIKHSPFSIGLRVIVVGSLIYWVFEKFIA